MATPTPAGPPSYWDTLKAAFHLRVPLSRLGRLPLNKILLAGFVPVGILGVAALGVPGLGFWLLATGLETAYLTALAGNRRFRNVVASRRYEEVAKDWGERIQQSLGRLDKASRARYARLEARCSEILDISKTLEGGPGSPGLEGLKESGLSQLLWIFLRLLVSRGIVEDNLGSADTRDLEREIAALKGHLEVPGIGEDLAKSKRATLQILEKRLENLAKANETMNVIDSEINRIEQQVELLREEAAVARNPQILSARIDSVGQTLSETSQWMSQNAVALGLLTGEAEGPPAPPPIRDPKEREPS